jgi:hypothetical protein
MLRQLEVEDLLLIAHIETTEFQLDTGLPLAHGPSLKRTYVLLRPYTYTPRVSGTYLTCAWMYSRICQCGWGSLGYVITDGKKEA